LFKRDHSALGEYLKKKKKTQKQSEKNIRINLTRENKLQFTNLYSGSSEINHTQTTNNSPRIDERKRSLGKILDIGREILNKS